MSNVLCLDSTATFLGVFDPSIAPALLYYSYIPVITLLLGMGIFIYIQKSSYKLPNKIFFLLTIIYSLYLLNEIIQWIAVPAGIITFSWELIVVFYTLIPILLVFFNIAYIYKKEYTNSFLLAGMLINLPLILLLPTQLNIHSVNLVECHGETGLLHYYAYTVLVVSVFVLVYILFKNIKKFEYSILTSGSALAILSILLADIISEHFWISEFNLFGPIGMLALICGIAYMMVRFNAFRIKVAGAQVLVLSLWVLVGSLLLVVKSDTSKVIALITLIFTTFAGYFLVRSVKREIKQREQIEQLASGLEQANDQLKVLDKMKSEFVSIASHQLRSPLTAIRGYSSMILEGSFGPVPEKAKDAVERISEASRFMASSVEDYLNVSRIQAGNMKYEYSDFNLKDLASRVADDTRQIALKKGLLLTFRSDLHKTGIVHADIGKTRQIIDNLVNNSLKYTPKGSIEVLVRDDVKAKKIFVEIKDTGIGMSPKTIENMFGKFERASNANEVNVTGTGLGLYIARKMAREMKGDVTAHSEGEGKGSLFRIELPLMM